MSDTDETRDREELEFDLVCVECGQPIRQTRVIESDVGSLAFYADEAGLESVDFHFHLPR